MVPKGGRTGRRRGAVRPRVHVRKRPCFPIGSRRSGARNEATRVKITRAKLDPEKEKDEALADELAEMDAEIRSIKGEDEEPEPPPKHNINNFRTFLDRVRREREAEQERGDYPFGVDDC